MRQGFRGWLSSWERYRLELIELLERGDRYFAAVRGSGRGAMSGAYAEDLFFQVWTFRDGRIVRIENFARARRGAAGPPVDSRHRTQGGSRAQRAEIAPRGATPSRR